MTVIDLPGRPQPADPLALELAREPRNDLGNARRMAARFGTDFLMVAERGWHRWDETHWRAEGAEAAIARAAHENNNRMYDEVEALNDRGEADNARYHLAFTETSGNSSRLAGAVRELGPMLWVPADAVDQNRIAFNCRTGTFDLGGGDESRPRPHDRAEHITRLAPVAFDPAATCPAFDAFLARVQPDPALRWFLQVWFGYCLSGLTGEQKFVFFFGTGANGKSTLIDLMCRIMGDYAVTLPFSSFVRDDRRRGGEPTPDLARLPGARLAVASEPERGARLGEATIKAITGGEQITARKLHHDFFDFRPEFKLLLSGNHRPRIDGKDEGIWRRVLLVPWQVTIPAAERQPDLDQRLWAEAPGVLNWLLEGSRAYFETGLPIPRAIFEATTDYRADSDPLGRFIEDCVRRDPATNVAASEMYRAYRDWCDANSERPWTQAGFGRALADGRRVAGAAIDKIKVHGGTMAYAGLRLENVPAMSSTPAEPVDPPEGP